MPASGTEAVGGPPGLAAAEVERSWHFRTLTDPPDLLSTKRNNSVLYNYFNIELYLIIFLNITNKIQAMY